jgi:hypothetical protein
MHYLQVNYLIDKIMPNAKSGNAFKVISAVARKTWGWKGKEDEWAELSYGDLSTLTGIKNINTLKAAIVDACEFVEQRENPNQGYSYRMKTMSKIDTVCDDTISEIDTEHYQNLIQPISEIDTDTRLSKEVKRNNKEYIYEHPDPEPIAEIKLALVKTCKTVLTPETADDYDKAAYEVFGWEGTPEQVMGFGEWWKANGYYDGLPALKSFRDEYRNYLQGIVIHSNGHNPQVSKTDIAKLFVDAASKYGRQPLKARESLGEHWPLIQHVKGGWSHLSKQSPDNIKFAIFSALKETS